MKTNRFTPWLLGLLMLSAAPVITACSDDDDNNNTDSPAQAETSTYDDLAYFQNAICWIDSLGQLATYNIGEALYESEPEHLYIGVDDIEEAAKWFRNWIAPDVKLADITPTVTDLTAQLTDTLGRAQGTIYFRAGTGSTVAEVTYSPETQLKYIDRITFLLNSAWPFNSSGVQWHKGDIRTFYVTGDAAKDLDDNDNPLNWVLIREARNGVKPMWCAITNNDYSKWTMGNFGHLRTSKYCPALSTANTISDILCSDWSYFASKFDEAGDGKLSYGESYWIDYIPTGGSFQIYVYDRRESNGTSSVLTGGTSQPVLLKIDWLADGTRTFLVTNSGTWSLTGSGPENLFDGTCTNIWDSRDWALGRSEVSGKDCWWFEFQPSDVFTPKSYTLWTTNVTGWDWAFYARIPSIWALYGKKNARSKWVQLDYRYAEELPHQSYAARTFNISNPQAYQTYRFEVYSHWGALNGTDSPMQLGQLVMNE